MDYHSNDFLPSVDDSALKVVSTANKVSAAADFNGMVGRTPRMHELFDEVQRVAPLDVGVLVQGESGTGKELVTRAIHQLSGRRGKFVAVNCGALAPDLLSSQLFGHERGSFTGATQAHAGFFEQAEGGTLFLDEITEMPPSLQVYLLRVAETHRLTRVGGSRDIPVDVRIVAASNRDLQHAVATGALRSDLYFRLLEFPLLVPPLRERREDVPLLARHFMRELNARHGARKRLSERALDELSTRYWPGNVRELQHVLQRQYIMSGDDGEIEAAIEAERPLYRRSSDRRRQDDDAKGAAAQTNTHDTLHFNVGATLEHVERTVVLATLAHCHNDKPKTARMLGISLKTVYNKLERYRAHGLFDADTPGSSE
jgi:DNA-binding NtrC family response regulator